MTRDLVREEINDAINDMRIVDTHEHFGGVFTPQSKYRLTLMNFLTRGYLRGDLESAGMKLPQLIGLGSSGGSKMIFAEKSAKGWDGLRSHLENVRNASYYRYLLIALHDLFGFRDLEIDDTNWTTLSQRVSKKIDNPSKRALDILEKMNIYRVILDNSWSGRHNSNIIEDDRLVQVVRMDGFITGTLQAVQRLIKRKIQCFDDYLNVLDDAFEKVSKAGAVGIKCALAYDRAIFFDTVSKSDAEKIFTKGLINVVAQKRKMFQDFMMHKVCERCAQHNLPIQIHTGIQYGNYNMLTNSKPSHLTNLFQKYPEVIFDLFHGGYPYMQEAGLLAKYFPNVYLDACWLAPISPTAYKRGLDEWLDILPANKIFAWGGDSGIIEHSYASLMLTKDLTSDVLATKVDSGYLSVKAAISVARKILGGNAIKVYGF